jgi:hypothetical protein
MSDVIVKVELNRVLFAMLGRYDLVEGWWDSPNRAFNHKTPNEVYWANDEGRARVARYIYSHAEASGS